MNMLFVHIFCNIIFKAKKKSKNFGVRNEEYKMNRRGSPCPHRPVCHNEKLLLLKIISMLVSSFKLYFGKELSDTSA